MGLARIKIGCSAILSGHEKVHGEAIVRAVGLALEQSNQAGATPYHLELIVLDDKDEPAPALAAARKFTTDPDLVGVIGPMNSQAAFEAGPEYERAGLVHISPAASNPELGRRGMKTFFRLAPHDLFQGDRAAEFAVQFLKKSRLAIIHDQSLFGLPLTEVFARKAQQLGAGIILNASISRGETDFSELAAEVANHQPELIFFGVIEEEGLFLAPQLRKAGVKSIYLGTDGLKASRYLATPGYSIPGPFHSNACCDISRQESAGAFRAAFENQYGPTYSVYSAEAFDAAGILIQALNRAGEPKAKEVLEQVRRTENYPGAAGIINFEANGDRRDPEIGFYELKSDGVDFIGMDREILG